MGKCYSHLSRDDRLKIELMLRHGFGKREIAEELQVHISTIYREVKRATYLHRNTDLTEEERYNPEEAQRKYREKLKEKGRGLKIGTDRKLLRFLEHQIIKEKKSPYAALEAARKSDQVFQTQISLSTCYNYIRKRVFPNIVLADCPMPHKKRKKKVQVAKKVSRGTSIEKRPEKINRREEVGHWEMDTVLGGRGSKKSLLVLTERATLLEVIEPLKAHTATEVVRALDRMERRIGEKAFRELFRSITVDNGAEFRDYKGIERSRRNKKSRTKIYVCHPYRSTERSRNENQNRFIRRYLPKGMNLDGISRNQIKQIEAWMNQYPRKIYGGRSAEEVFLKLIQEATERGWIA